MTNKSVYTIAKWINNNKKEEDEELEKNKLMRKLVAKQDLVEAITYDRYEDDREEYTEEEQEKIKKFLNKIRYGAGASTIIKCKGALECKFASDCEFARLQKEPEGLPCIVEEILFADKLAKYINTYDVDPTNEVELTYCNELAEIDIELRRANISLANASDGEFVITEEFESRTGDLIENTAIAPQLEAREKLKRRREKINRLMCGDREVQYKKQAALKIKRDDDIALDQSKKVYELTKAKMEKREKEKQLNAADSDLTEKPKENVISPDAIIMQSLTGGDTEE